jgi:hypothetical protein
LEHIGDLDSLVDWLSGQFRFCVASYAYFDPGKGAGVRIKERLQRFYHGYMNTYTEAEIVALFQRHGYVRVKEETWTNQRIFQFVKQQIDSA